VNQASLVHSGPRRQPSRSLQQRHGGGSEYATLWSGGVATNLGGLPGSSAFSVAYGINGAGKVVGFSVVGGIYYATLWSGGVATNLGAVPGN
jgi:uncharacterized membrane protein